MPTNVFIDASGITGVKGLSGSFTRGISPSTFTVYCIPQDVQGGTGTLTFGSGESVMQFVDCAVAASFVRQHTGTSPLMAVKIQDRRWKWKFSVVNGHYNTRSSEGTVDPATKKEPRELATYILQAMGETNFNVSFMPTGVFPPADWVNKRADIALQELCDYVACDVVLNPQDNSVEIWPLGVGQGLGELGGQVRHVPRVNVPATIECRTGPVRWQTRLKLRPVSRDATTPRQRSIHDIEYKPQGGWELQSPFTFQSITNTLQRAILFATMWREYRVVGQADGSLTPPFCNQPVSSVDQYILDDYLIESETDVEGYKRQMPFYIGGTYWPYTDLPQNCDPEQYYNGEATLYKDRRMVTFPIPIHGFNSSGQPVEPTLYLFTSYRVETTAGELVYLFWRDNTSSGTGGKLILERPEIFAIFNNAGVPGSATDTSQQALSEASNYVSIFKRKYENPNASEVTVAGFQPALLNGVLTQVSWNLTGASAPFTKAYDNWEGDPYSVSQSERRRREKVASLAEPEP